MKNHNVNKKGFHWLKENWLTLLTTAIAVLSFIFSVIAHGETIDLEEKYNTLNTYMMSLNYQVHVSQEEGNFKFADIEINGGQIDIVPKTGGIEKVYAIHYYEGNVKGILPVDLYADNIKDKDADTYFYRLTDYTIDQIAYTEDRWYGTLYLVVKDYQNNYYTNMLVFDVDRDDASDYEVRVYEEMDLLYTYNNDSNPLPEFDAQQMTEYQRLRDYIREIV